MEEISFLSIKLTKNVMCSTFVLKHFSDGAQNRDMEWNPEVLSLCYESQHTVQPSALTS